MKSMRMCLPLAVAIVGVVTADGAASAERYRGVQENCQPTVEKLMRNELRNGEKVVKAHLDVGDVKFLRVQWDSGNLVDVLVAPVDGRGVCIVASHLLGRQVAAGSPGRPRPAR